MSDPQTDLLGALENVARYLESNGRFGRKAVRAAAEEIVALRSALDWAAQRIWDGYEIDGGDFQQEMGERGLLVEVPASQEFKDEYDDDVMLVMRWSKT